MVSAIPAPVPVTFPVEPGEIGPSQIAAWVFPPENVSPLFPSQWLLCIPGLTYRGLAYFDRQVAGHPSLTYSMARWLALQGIGSIVIDNLGTGESDVPASISGLSLNRRVYLDAYKQLVIRIRERLICGTLLEGLAPADPNRLFLVGVGHGIGGLLATALQAGSDVCDALCLLGWSPLTIPQLPADLDTQTLATTLTPSGYLPPERLRSALRPFLYSPTVSEALMKADEQDATVVPAGLLKSWLSGERREEAARLTCPLLLGFAMVDMTQTPHGEAAAYPSACSMTLFVQLHAHHCANFARTRFELWDEVAAWVRLRSVQATSDALPSGFFAERVNATQSLSA